MPKVLPGGWEVYFNEVVAVGAYPMQCALCNVHWVWGWMGGADMPRGRTTACKNRARIDCGTSREVRTAVQG